MGGGLNPDKNTGSTRSGERPDSTGLIATHKTRRPGAKTPDPRVEPAIGARILFALAAATGTASTAGDARGRPLALLTVRKIRQYPIDFGNATLLESVRGENVERLAMQFFQGLAYRRIGTIEFKRDACDGQLRLIELNTRLPQNRIHCTRCGVNLPLLAYLDLTGQRPHLSWSTGRVSGTSTPPRTSARERKTAHSPCYDGHILVTTETWRWSGP